MESSIEWDTVDVNSPIRQGDILISRDPASLEVMDIRFVLTADCDIDKKKFGQFIACLHVEPLKRYLRNAWANKQLNSLVAEEQKGCHARFMKWIRNKNANAGDISYAAMDKWIQRASVEDICTEIEIPEDQANKFIKLTSKYKCVLQTLNDVNGGDQFEKLCICEEQVRGGTLAKIKQKQWRKACSEKLPEDVFIVSELPQLDDVGFAIRLRDVIPVDATDIVTTAAHAKDSNKLFRIARMKPTYKYAVSQSFGLLFSRIGMPTEYESAVKDLFSLVEPE